jgi:hypothetical protein
LPKPKKSCVPPKRPTGPTAPTKLRTTGGKTQPTIVVRGPAESDSNLIIVPGLVPLVDKQTGEIEYIVAHAEWDRLDAMTPVSG